MKANMKMTHRSFKRTYERNVKEIDSFLKVIYDGFNKEIFNLGEDQEADAVFQKYNKQWVEFAMRWNAMFEKDAAKTNKTRVLPVNTKYFYNYCLDQKII